MFSSAQPVGLVHTAVMTPLTLVAPGYDYAFQLGIPIYGRSGISLQEKWTPYPKSYMAVCVDGFPNYFLTMGPNSCVSSGSQLTIIERQVDYMVEAVKKLQRERLKSIEVKPEAVKAFDDYIEVSPYLFASHTVLNRRPPQNYFPKVDEEHLSSQLLARLLTT